jgi:hypothetical protein
MGDMHMQSIEKDIIFGSNFTVHMPNGDLFRGMPRVTIEYYDLYDLFSINPFVISTRDDPTEPGKSIRFLFGMEELESEEQNDATDSDDDDDDESDFEYESTDDADESDFEYASTDDDDEPDFVLFE